MATCSGLLGSELRANGVNALVGVDIDSADEARFEGLNRLLSPAAEGYTGLLPAHEMPRMAVHCM